MEQSEGAQSIAQIGGSIRSSALDAQPNALDLIDQMVKEVTFDEFMRRNPHTMTDADFRAAIEADRRERAAFAARKKEKEDATESGD